MTDHRPLFDVDEILLFHSLETRLYWEQDGDMEYACPTCGQQGRIPRHLVRTWRRTKTLQWIGLVTSATPAGVYSGMTIRELCQALALDRVLGCYSEISISTAAGERSGRAREDA